MGETPTLLWKRLTKEGLYGLASSREWARDHLFLWQSIQVDWHYLLILMTWHNLATALTPWQGYNQISVGQCQRIISSMEDLFLECPVATHLVLTSLDFRSKNIGAQKVEVICLWLHWNEVLEAASTDGLEVKSIVLPPWPQGHPHDNSAL